MERKLFPMKQYQVGVVGATGMVGQRFVSLLENHPWFRVAVLAASPRSAGKTYEEAVGSRWAMSTPMPEAVKKMVVLDASDVKAVASKVDFIFCAVDMKKDEIKALEEAYAKAECPVISNNSAHRMTPDVPMIIPEVNPGHAEVIPFQRARLGTKRGFIAVKSNCSLQSYVPALHPLMTDYGVTKTLVCTYQAISGAGKTFERWPEMVDNVIPYIGGEEEKSEREPLKIWGSIKDGVIVPVESPLCLSPSVKSPRWRKLKLYGKTSRAVPKNWLSPAPPNSSCATSRSRTARRRGSTATSKTAWRCRSAGCARTPSTTTNLCASPTTPCAGRRAAAFCWPSCSRQRAILTEFNRKG